MTGVGTKPDTVVAGNLSKIAFWTNILEGNKSNLHHGYYSVKMPDDQERRANLTRQQIQQREEDFFENTKPWSEVRNRNRLGMRNFVDNTSRILIALIERK